MTTSPHVPDSPLRVLVATSVHTPTDARIYHRQIRGMLDAGWEVTYVAPWDEPPPAIDRLTPVAVRRARGRHRIRAAIDVRRELRRRSPHHDLVLVHDPELVPIALSVRRARPVVWDVHEDTAAALSDRSWVPGVMRPLLWRVVRRVERLAERRCSLLLAERSYAQRFATVHPFVPNLPWARPVHVEPRTEPRAVYVGRISVSRGLPEMLAVARALAGEVEVVLIGGPDTEVAAALEDADRDGVVRWLGELPNDRALQEVEGAVAGLSLLRDEPNFRGSLPTKVVEYLATGVPAVTTPLPEAVRILESHRAGTVVAFGDVDAAVRAIRDLVRDPMLWRERSVTGQRAVHDELSWDRHLPGFLRALRSAL